MTEGKTKKTRSLKDEQENPRAEAKKVIPNKQEVGKDGMQEGKKGTERKKKRRWRYGADRRTEESIRDECKRERKKKKMTERM